MKTCAGIERHFRPGKVICVTDGIGDKRVVASWLVIRGDKKRVIQRIGTLSGDSA
ncbi:hypothetical protein D3C71_1187370 [compost metagenome]